MQQDHLPAMVTGVKTSMGGVGGVAGGTWIAQYSVEIGVACMVVGALCSIVGLVITYRNSRK